MAASTREGHHHDGGPVVSYWCDDCARAHTPDEPYVPPQRGTLPDPRGRGTIGYVRHDPHDDCAGAVFWEHESTTIRTRAIVAERPFGDRPRVVARGPIGSRDDASDDDGTRVVVVFDPWSGMRRRPSHDARLALRDARVAGDRAMLEARRISGDHVPHECPRERRERDTLERVPPVDTTIRVPLSDDARRALKRLSTLTTPVDRVAARWARDEARARMLARVARRDRDAARMLDGIGDAKIRSSRDAIRRARRDPARAGEGGQR